jgi:hypothetical protein
LSEITASDRALLDSLQRAMSTLPQATGFITRHHFADGMYARELTRKAGTLIVGKVHKREHFYIVLCGTVEIYGLGRFTGPAILISAPGTKRAVYAHTDAICATVHRTPYKDLDEVEADLIEPDATALFDARNEVKTPVLEHL